MVSQSLMGLSAAWPLTTIDSRPGSYRRFLDGQRIAVLSPRLSRVEVWKELGEVRHLLVAVLVQPRPDAVREELNSRLGSGSQFLGIEIAQPEVDHPALAADHRSAAGHMERAVLEAQVAGLEGAACS